MKVTDFHKTEERIEDIKKEVDLQLAQMVKKDGSVLIDAIPQSGPGGGLNFSTQDGKAWKLVGSGGGSFRLLPLDTDGTVANYGLTIEENHIRPHRTGEYSLGLNSVTWKDAWIGNYDRSQNGYCKLTNGLIMQWGVYKGTPNSATITLPIAFPTSINQVFLTPRKTGTANIMTSYDLPGDYKSSFILQRNTDGCWISWYAIGY